MEMEGLHGSESRLFIVETDEGRRKRSMLKKRVLKSKIATIVRE